MGILGKVIRHAFSADSAAQPAAAAPVTPPAAPVGEQVGKVNFLGETVRFRADDNMAAWRISSFFEKEPDTVAWLSRIPRGAVFLDIGANVGMYAVTMAVANDCQVIAFEPESQNYALLNANIALNRVSDKVRAYCVALSDKVGLDALYLSTFSTGSSCHSFGSEVGFDLKPRHSPFVQGAIGMTLDSLVESGQIPVPEYIKIDVDGFEHKVIAGAMKTLARPEVREILIELNYALPEHQALLQTFESLGFYFSENQRLHAMRKSGTFEGVGELIFRRVRRDILNISFNRRPGPTLPEEAYRPVLEHIIARIQATEVQREPFPHLVIDNFFPEDYFQKILEEFPLDEEMIPLSETGRTAGQYKERLVTLFTPEHFARLSESRQLFWQQFAGWLYSEAFIQAVVERFWPHLAGWLATLDYDGTGVDVQSDALIISDKTRYSIGPHTDALHRLVTFLFYFPPTGADAEGLGTSIYAPKDPYMHVNHAKHYDFEPFDRVATIDFKANRALMFVRNDRSFHGVEPITKADPQRHLVINNIRIADRNLLNYK